MTSEWANFFIECDP